MKAHQILFNYDEQDLLVIKFIQDKYQIKTQTGALRKALQLSSENEKLQKQLQETRALAGWAERIIKLQKEAMDFVKI